MTFTCKSKTFGEVGVDNGVPKKIIEYQDLAAKRIFWQFAYLRRFQAILERRPQRTKEQH